MNHNPQETFYDGRVCGKITTIVRVIIVLNYIFNGNFYEIDILIQSYRILLYIKVVKVLINVYRKWKQLTPDNIDLWKGLFIFVQHQKL